MKKKFNKKDEEAFYLIFGILCGSGLFLIVSAGVSLITRLISTLEPYSLILFIIIYIPFLISTSRLVKKGWFKSTYIIVSTLILLRFILIETGILGVI